MRGTFCSSRSSTRDALSPILPARLAEFREHVRAVQRNPPAKSKGALTQRELRSRSRHAEGAENIRRHVQRMSPARFRLTAGNRGAAAELKKVADYFGLYFTDNGGQIVHSLSTTVISPEGTDHSGTRTTSGRRRNSSPMQRCATRGKQLDATRPQPSCRDALRRIARTSQRRIEHLRRLLVNFRVRG